MRRGAGQPRPVGASSTGSFRALAYVHAQQKHRWRWTTSAEQGEDYSRRALTLAWSACTKLAAGVDEPFAGRLASGGCATVEVGLETLTPDGQLLFDKRQTPELFRRVLGSLVGAGISVVVNYITGLPGVDPAEEAHWLAWVRREVAGVGPLAKVEHNTFQLERLSPMGKAPDRYGLRVTRTWPWASVMAWELLADSKIPHADADT